MHLGKTAILAAGALAFSAAVVVAQPVLPRGTNVASLVVISQGNLTTSAQQLLIATLQGVVARQSGAKIYIDGGSGYSIWDKHLNTAYGIPMTTVTSPWVLLNQFKGLVHGYIRCNLSANTNSLDAATSLCGPYNAIAVDTSIESTVKSYGITNLIADMSGASDQFVWTNASPNYNAMLSRSVVVEQKQSFYANLRDYATLANAFTFFEGNDSFRASVIGTMNPAAACLGWGDASQGEDVFVGADSSAGVVTIASDWALDLSTLSGIRDPLIRQHTYDIPTPQTNLNYVTFVMTDGDNVQENLGSDYTVYQSGYRGKFSFGWSLSASLADLAPSVLRWYFDNASNGPSRDFFVAGPSGLGYFYPSQFPSSDLAVQIEQLNDCMTRADMDITQILDFNSFNNAALWNQYLAQPNINALIYLEYSQYNDPGGAIYFSTNGKPILSCSDLIWGGLESPAQVAANANNAPRDPSNPSSYKLVEYHLNDSTYPNLSSVLQVVTNLAAYVQVVTPEEYQRLVVANVGRKLSFDFASSAQGWMGYTSGWPYDEAYWANTLGNPPGALLMDGSHLGFPVTDMNSWFTRQIILPPNATALSFDTLAVNDGLLQVQIQPPSGGLVTLLPWAGLSPANSWFTVTASLTNFAGQTVTLYFEQLDGGQGSGEARCVDNVQVLTAGPAVYFPAAPKLLSATAGSTVNLLWRDNDTNETSFEVDRSLGASGAWSQIASLPAGSTTYSDMSVSAGTSYSYRVRSWNGQGGSPYSNVQTVTNPPSQTFNGLGMGWSLNGTSEGGYIFLNTLELTDGQKNESRSSFLSNALYVGAFQATFTYTDVNGNGADGACFVVQNDPRGTAALGGGGGSLGYSGITPSMSVQFNIYAGNGLGGAGVAFGEDGTIAKVNNTAPVNIDLGDPINVTLTYIGGVARVFLQDTVNNATFSMSTNVNIPAVLGTNVAYVGFTGADGGTASAQTIANFQFISLVNLTAQSSGTNIVLSWLTASSAYQLQSNTSLASTNWVNVTNSISVTNGQYEVTVPRSAGLEFYRLRLQGS